MSADAEAGKARTERAPPLAGKKGRRPAKAARPFGAPSRPPRSQTEPSATGPPSTAAEN